MITQRDQPHKWSTQVMYPLLSQGHPTPHLDTETCHHCPLVYLWAIKETREKASHRLATSIPVALIVPFSIL